MYRITHPYFSLQIQVQILTGRKIALVVDQANDTVEDIQHKIQTKEGVHPDQQLLLHNGIILTATGTSVQELKLQEGSLLFMSLRNRGG